MSETITLLDGLDGTRTLEMAGRTDGDRILLDADAVRDGLGWKLESEGLCQGDVCIPVRDREALVHGDALDLETLAGLLDRPLAQDAAERAAVLGTDHLSRAQGLATLEAPDFELPDLDGKLHRLSDQRGRKVLLIAYASW